MDLKEIETVGTRRTSNLSSSHGSISSQLSKKFSKSGSHIYSGSHSSSKKRVETRRLSDSSSQSSKLLKKYSTTSSITEMSEEDSCLRRSSQVSISNTLISAERRSQYSSFNDPVLELAPVRQIKGKMFYLSNDYYVC